MRQVFQQLSPDKPYFPEALAAVQAGPGSIMRHVWMCAAVYLLKGDSPSLRVLEVGSWAGNSTLTWAEAIARFDRDGTILCVDPWQPYLAEPDAADEKRGYHLMVQATNLDLIYGLFLHNIGFADRRVRVDHFRARFADIASYLGDGQFDIVYIDGSHYYEDVRADIREARRLVREGGLICGDDLEWQLHDVDPAFVRDNLARDFAVDGQGRGMHPGVTLAVAEAFGKVVNFSGFWIMRKEAGGFVEARLHKAEVFIPSHFRDEDKRAVYEWMRVNGLVA